MGLGTGTGRTGSWWPGEWMGIGEASGSGPALRRQIEVRPDSAPRVREFRVVGVGRSGFERGNGRRGGRGGF